jgi:small conductance mechanosensitive channel
VPPKTIHVQTESVLPSSASWETAVVIVVALFAAWMISRLSTRMAEAMVRRNERRKLAGGAPDTAVLRSLKRRQTTVSLVRTSVRYVAWGVAIAIILLQVTDGGRGGAVIGASLVVVLLGFALQRFLIDLVSGTFMFFEGWFDVGDTIHISPWDLTGVVEETSLRSTTLRSVTGELIRISNGQIGAVRVFPRGVRELDIEAFVSDEAAGRQLFEDVARLMPAGPTHFVTVPTVEHVERLDDNLYSIQARAAVAPGREWLAEDFLTETMRERAEEGLLVHGPVVMHRDERAEARYARSLGLGDAPPPATPAMPKVLSKAQRAWRRRGTS